MTPKGNTRTRYCGVFIEAPASDATLITDAGDLRTDENKFGCALCGSLFMHKPTVRLHFYRTCVPKLGNVNGIFWDDHDTIPKK